MVSDMQDLARALLHPLKRYGHFVRRLDDNFLPFEFRLAAQLGERDCVTIAVAI